MSKEAELVEKLQNPALKDIAFSELLDVYQERLYWHIRKIVQTHENADDFSFNYKISCITIFLVTYLW